MNVNSLPLALEFNLSNNCVYIAGTLSGTEGLVLVIGQFSRIVGRLLGIGSLRA